MCDTENASKNNNVYKYVYTYMSMYNILLYERNVKYKVPDTLVRLRHISDPEAYK